MSDWLLFLIDYLLFFAGLTTFFFVAYYAGRADILRRVWKRVSGRERVKFTFTPEFEKRVSEGMAYPRGYGFAYYDYRWDIKIAYPVPFNLIARGARRVHLWYLEWFVSGVRGKSKWDQMLATARVSGWHEGRAQGRKDGLEVGLKKGRKQGYDGGHNDGFADGRTILLSDLAKEIERILSDGIAPNPEIVRATLVNAMRDSANDDAEKTRRAKMQGYIKGYFDRKRFS